MHVTPETAYEHVGSAAHARGGAAARLAIAADAAARRTLDVLVATVLLLLLLPVILVAMLLIKADSPGPVFYRGRRVGYKGKELHLLKFRKMSDGAAGAKITAGKDHRLTRVGAWLTHLKIDEVPQLWQVLTGEMSLVGPRPEDPEFVAMRPDDYALILEVRPGITGYSQLAFAEEIHILNEEDPLAHYVDRLFPQKLGLDKMYARDHSLWLNVRILAWTVAAVILRRAVAVNRETGAMNLRRR